jgi:hypothetical protein
MEKSPDKLIVAQIVRNLVQFMEPGDSVFKKARHWSSGLWGIAL